MAEIVSDDWTRFWSRVDLLHPSGCWPMSGATNSSGYVGFGLGGKSFMAHRLVLEYVGREIPPTMEVDHLCKNTICVNPAHLEVVTAYVNNMRSNSVAAVNQRKTHCKNGHAFTEANTYKGNDYYKGKHCRTCHREREQARRDRKKAERLELAA